MAQVIVTSKKGMQQQSHGGVRFFNSPSGVISEEISEEKAEEFLVMPDHFKLHLGEPVAAPTAKRAASSAPPTPTTPAAKPFVPTRQGQAATAAPDPSF